MSFPNITWERAVGSKEERHDKNSVQRNAIFLDQSMDIQQCTGLELKEWEENYK
jgi:hypothetical protein